MVTWIRGWSIFASFFYSSSKNIWQNHDFCLILWLPLLKYFIRNLSRHCWLWILSCANWWWLKILQSMDAMALQIVFILIKIIGSYHAVSSSISGGTNLQFWRVCSKIWPTLSNFSCKHYRIESWYQPFKIYPTWRCNWMPLEYAFSQVVGIIEWDHFDPSGACWCQSISNFIESISSWFYIISFLFLFLFF